MKMKARKGFTLIELLIVIGIIVVLAGVVIIALNPARQFALARNSQRWSNVNALLNAVGQRMAENKGIWDPTCGGIAPTPVPLPFGTTTYIGRDTASGYVDLEKCLVPDYLASMLKDPNGGTDNNTGYRIISTSSRITIDAPNAMTDIVQDLIEVKR